jgi:hypothetical protein
MTIYDISYPHDLRVPMNKSAITTEELDAYFADPNADEDIKRMLLLDVQQQGYQPKP